MARRSREVAPVEPSADTEMSLEELNAEIHRLTVLRDGKMEGARREFIERTRREAEELGVPLEELKVSTKGKSSRPAEVVYRDGEHTWTNRGRMTKHFADKKAAGEDIEQFRVRPA